MVLKFNYNCQICHEQFKNCGGLTAHLKFKHKNEMSYETYYLKYMNTKSIPGECVICGMPTPFLNLNKGYKLTCSRKCGVQLNIKNQKIDNYAKAKATRSITLKNKFGITDENLEITSPFCIKKIRDKSIETWHENYGENIDNPFQADKVKQTIQKTMLKKYGGKTTMESKVLKEKVQKTNNKIYGGNSPICSSKIHDKIINSIKNNYNIKEQITTPFEVKEIRDKSVETNIKHWGFSCGLKNKKVQEKIEKTLFKKYGYKKIYEIPEFIKKRKRKIKFEDFWFDSKPELAYYIWLKDHNIDFEYHPCLLTYKFNDKEYRYEPDFKVNNRFVEIKGIQFFENRNPNGKMKWLYRSNKTEEELLFLDNFIEAKHQFMLNQNVLILTNYDTYIKYVKNKYGKNYLDTFKNRSI